MFKNRKIESRLRVGEPEKRKLRMLRSYQAPQASLISMKEADQENVCEYSRKDFRTTMLEAEYKKAKALMASQDNPHSY